MSDVVQLAEFKDYLNLTGNTGPGGDAELQSMLDSAEEMIADRCGVLVPTPVTGEMHDGGSPVIVLDNHVVSVTSVSEFRGGRLYAITEQPFTSDPTTWTAYGFTRQDSILTRRARGYTQNWAPGAGNIVVTYSAGLAATPPAVIHQAVCELGRHLFGTQQGSRRGQTTEWNPGMSFAMPRRVLELIQPWDRGTRVS